MYKVGDQVLENQLKLNANEGYDYLNQSYHRYPAPKVLYQEFAQFYGVDQNELLMTSGVDGSLDIIFKWLKINGGKIVSFSPTYGFYKILAAQLGLQYEEVPFLEGGSFSQEALTKLIDQNTLIILCRPNNPTGDLTDQSLLKKLLELKANVLLDEAYVEFEENGTLIDWIHEHENLIVCRTLSKAYGLAGLRIGFTFTNAKLIEEFLPFLPPYPIPTSNLEILKKLFKDQYFSFCQEQFPKIRERRSRLRAVMSIFGETFEPHANFITLRSKQAQSLYENGKVAGFVFRYFNFGSYELLRVTIPSEKNIDQVCSFFQKEKKV